MLFPNLVFAYNLIIPGNYFNTYTFDNLKLYLKYAHK